MLNVPVPYTAPATPQSFKYNYPPSIDHSPSSSRRTSTDCPRKSSVFSTETEQWSQLTESIKHAPPVIAFFSFVNINSKKWALDHKVVDNLRKNLPQGTTVARYHVATRNEWDFGETLTHAWAVADSLQVDDKIIEPIFQAVHGKRVTDLEGIREIFEGVGVPPDMVSKEWMTQKTLMGKKRMEDAASHIEVQDLPAILVGGKYLVKLDVYEREQQFDMNGVIDVVKFLLAKEVDSS